MQQEQTMTQQPAYLQEDEIDLRELFMTLKKHLGKIVLFVCVVVSLALLYVLSLPNSYRSQTLLAPLSQTKSMGGLSALAGMAGIDLGSGGEVATYDYLDAILKDYEFNTYIIDKKNSVKEKC